MKEETLQEKIEGTIPLSKQGIKLLTTVQKPTDLAVLFYIHSHRGSAFVDDIVKKLGYSGIPKDQILESLGRLSPFMSRVSGMGFEDGEVKRVNEVVTLYPSGRRYCDDASDLVHRLTKSQTRQENLLSFLETHRHSLRSLSISEERRKIEVLETAVQDADLSPELNDKLLGLNYVTLGQVYFDFEDKQFEEFEEEEIEEFYYLMKDLLVDNLTATAEDLRDVRRSHKQYVRTLRLKQHLQSHIRILELPSRVESILEGADIHSIQQLCKITPEGVCTGYKNFSEFKGIGDSYQSTIHSALFRLEEGEIK